MAGQLHFDGVGRTSRSPGVGPTLELEPVLLLVVINQTFKLITYV